MEKVCSKKNRTILMGMAIVAITICHINQFIGVHKGLQTGIANEFLYASAAVGVDIFFFFSLIGLGFSYEKNKLIHFYWHRINRIYPIYLLFLLIVLFIFYREFGLDEKWEIFGQQIFGIAATKVVSQRIEWYIPSLLILYTFYPLLFFIVKYIHESKYSRNLEFLVLVAIIFSSYLFRYFFVGLFSMRLPLYFLAILSYFYVRDGKSRNLIELFIFAACCSFIIKNELLSYALLIPLFLFVADEVIDSWKATRCGTYLSWLGQYTLEIYLAQVIATKYLIKELPTSNVLLITCIVFIATALLAFVFNRFQYFISSSLKYLSSEINQSNSHVRLSWVDAAKGYAMFIIMWGHMQQLSSLKMWLTSFHVPLFLVLSGILMARKSHVGGAKYFINKLLYPYLTFSIIAIVCYFVYGMMFRGITSGMESLLVNFYKTITGYGIYAIWFIPSYFIACWMFSFSFGKPLKWQFVLLFVWAFIGMAGSELFVWLKGEIADQRYYDLLYYPLAALLRGMACTYYIVLGYILFRLYKIACNFGYIKLKLFLLLTGLFCLMSSIVLSQNLEGTNFSLLCLGDYPYMNFLCGTVGAIWSILFFYLIKRIYTFPLLQWIGRKSLIIMGTHMSLLLTIFIPKVLSHIIIKPENDTVEYYLFGIICVMVMIIIELPIIISFDNSLKVFISKKNN